MEEQQENRLVLEVRRIINELNKKFGVKWQTYATGAAAIIIAAVLTIYFITSYNETKDSYWEKISMANSYAYQGMANQAIQILDDVINKYSNYGLAQYARLSKANILFDTKNYKLAANIYQEVISTGKQKTIIPFAYAGLGQSKENLSDYAGAEAVYKEEIEKYSDHFITPRIYDSLARVYIFMGKIDDAKQTYEKLATLYPGSYWSNVAQKFVFSINQARQPASQPSQAAPKTLPAPTAPSPAVPANAAPPTPETPAASPPASK